VNVGKFRLTLRFLTLISQQNPFISPDSLEKDPNRLLSLAR
jgi:hypothetical protein